MIVPEFNDSYYEDLWVECSRSTRTLAKTFLPERFYAPFSSLHDEIFELIDSGAPRIAIAAPRGMGKTSIVGLAKTAQAILFQLRKFIPYVSSSFDAAVLQTENLKRELLTNKEIKSLFGSIKTSSKTGLDESFSKKTWVAHDNTLVFPRGSGQQIRGILFKNARPDLFIVDDFEDPENIHNENIRKKNKEWFNADLLKATSRFDHNWQIIYIDTLKHEDALLQDLLDSVDWESIRLEICDDNYEPTAPEFFSKAEIDKEVAYHREQGILDVFYREYRNLPIASEDAVFAEKNFRYYQEGPDYLTLGAQLKERPLNRYDVENTNEPEFAPADFHSNRIRKSDLMNVVIVDPAKTVKLQSADSAVVGVGVSRFNQSIFFRDCVSDKMYPDELYSTAFNMVERMKAMVLAVEVTSLNEFIVQPIKNEMRVRKLAVMFEELQARGKKEERIASLSPYYRQGYIWHNPQVSSKLEGQLLGFPRSKLWDIMDAFAYIVFLMDKLNWLFDPPDDSDDLVDDYDDLHNERPMEYVQLI